jgi:hypothetical protein
MAKVKFQVDGFDANQTSIFNQNVTFDGNVEANTLSINGTDIFTAIPPGPAYSTSEPASPTVGQVWIDSDSSVTTYDMSTYATLANPTFTGNVVLPSTTSIGNITSTELGYIDGVTSSIQTQLGDRALTSDFSNTAWTAYTPTWTSDSGSPSIGNGTLVGRYKQLGKTVFFNLKLTYGSTTTGLCRSKPARTSRELRPLALSTCRVESD